MLMTLLLYTFIINWENDTALVFFLKYSFRSSIF